MRQCYLFACHTSITARKFITEFNNPEKVAITRLRTTQKVAKVQKNHPEKVAPVPSKFFKTHFLIPFLKLYINSIKIRANKLFKSCSEFIQKRRSIENIINVSNQRVCDARYSPYSLPVCHSDCFSESEKIITVDFLLFLGALP